MAGHFFAGFERFDVEVSHGGGSVRLHGVRGGEGPPVLLLHGYPQTHVTWHRVAPALAERHAVVAPDLRGYGASGKPASAPDHATYSKRAMAADALALMRGLGHERFAVCGHDRGGRVGHRLALDAPEAVERLMVLDIAPTREMYANTTDAFARAYWHWFFLIRPAPFPEDAIGADSDRWFRAHFGRKAGGGDGTLAPFDPDALEAYLDAFRDPEAVRASCEDYRAAASIDLAHDDADGGARVRCPLRALWGERGTVGACFDPLALWRLRAERVSGRALPGGHYLPEECSDAVLGELIAFLAGEEPPIDPTPPAHRSPNDATSNA